MDFGVPASIATRSMAANEDYWDQLAEMAEDASYDARRRLVLALATPKSITEGASGEPPLPPSASDEELLDRVEDSRMFAEMNLGLGEGEADAANATSLLEDALAHAWRVRDPCGQEIAKQLASMLAQTHAADEVQHKAEEAEIAAAIRLSLEQDADAADASDEALLTAAMSASKAALAHVSRDDDGNVRIERHEDASHAIALLDRARAYAMRVRAPNREVVQGIVGCMGRIHFATSELRAHEGRQKESIETCELALVCLRDAGDRAREITARTRLGMMLARRGEHEKAAQQIAMLRETGASEGTFLHMLSGRQHEVRRLGDLAEVQLTVGDIRGAANKLRQALEVCTDESDRRHLLMALCDLAYKSGDFSETVQLSTQVMELSMKDSLSPEDMFSTDHAIVMMLCAKALFYDGQRREGLERCEQLLMMLHTLPGWRGSSTEAETLLALGILHHLDGQQERAASYVSAQLAIAEARGNAQSKAEGYFNLACICRKLGQHKQVIDHCTRVLDIGERLWRGVVTDQSRLEYVAKLAPSSRMLVDALSRTGDVEKALEQAERGRSRALDLLLLRQRLDPIGPGNAWSRRLVARGESEPPESLPTAGFATGAGLKAMREIAVARRVAIVMFTCADLSECPELLVWVVGSTGKLTFRRLEIPAEIGSLAQLVELTRRTCKIAPRRSTAPDGPRLDEERLARDMAALEDDREPQPTAPRVSQAATASAAARLPLRRCHQLLIEPLADVLADEPRLLLLPDLQLYALPFAALQDCKGAFLIERHMVTVAPSVATVLELESRLTHARRATPGRKSLVVGNPNFCGREEQLSGASAEAKTVHGLLEAHGRPAALLTHDGATKEAVMAVIRTSDIVHFATHGKADGVLLAGPSAVEGILSMSELQALKLQSAPLMVLSACDTFCGELGTDGVVGIARSCLVAGASSLLASLWPLDDEATSELMAGFYKRLLTGGAMDVAAALQGAMIAMLRRGAPVCQWAAFVAYGLQHASKTATSSHLLQQPRPTSL